MTKTKNERFFLLTGKWLSRRMWVAKAIMPNQGTPVSVAFNANHVVSRESIYGDVLGFYHTHPQMQATPSSTDYKTMNAWRNCLGKDLICLIDGVNGLKTYYWLGDDAWYSGKTFKFENFFFGLLDKW